MRANVYAGVINDKCKLVLVNDEMLLYPFDQPAWGYCGSGPAKVAEAIMVNELGRDCDRQIVNDFKEQVVAHWLGRVEWVLTSQDIQNWLEERVRVER